MSQPENEEILIKVPILALSLPCTLVTHWLHSMPFPQWGGKETGICWPCHFLEDHGKVLKLRTVKGVLSYSDRIKVVWDPHLPRLCGLFYAKCSSDIVTFFFLLGYKSRRMSSLARIGDAGKISKPVHKSLYSVYLSCILRSKAVLEV